MNLFERVYVINLKRRPDRLAEFFSQFDSQDWPFPRPVSFAAIDGQKIPCPPEFKEGGGAFGCRQSHLAILQQCMMDDVKSVLVLEDDARLLPGFNQRVRDFLNNVPEDWQGMYFGGQHIRPPKLIKTGVVKAVDVERTHAYACRGNYLRALYSRWSFATVHIDWMMRDWQHLYPVYCPERFLISQGSGTSDINGRFNGSQSWNPAKGDEPIVVLQAPRPVAEMLRRHGLHLGYRRDALTGYDVGLKEIFDAENAQPKSRALRLKQWIMMIQAEANAERGFIGTIWHPDCNLGLLRTCTSAKVHVIKAMDSEAGLNQLSKLNLLDKERSIIAKPIVLLRSDRPVFEAMRVKGFHGGYWRNSLGQDRGLSKIVGCESKSERIDRLSNWLLVLQTEADSIQNGVVTVWHPGIIEEELRLAATDPVFTISAESYDAALGQFSQVWQPPSACEIKELCVS